jgi:hypothetical protein
MLPSEVGAAVRPTARGDHGRPGHRRRSPKINFAGKVGRTRVDISLLTPSQCAGPHALSRIRRHITDATTTVINREAIASFTKLGVP